MKRWKLILIVAIVATALIALATSVLAAADPGNLVAKSIPLSDH